MTIYILPSVIALGIKIWLFMVSRMKLFRDNPFLAMFLCALFGLNVAELFILLLVDNPASALGYMMAYYVAAVFSAATYLLLAMNVIRTRAWLNHGIVASGMLLSVLVCIPDFFISGTTSIGYSLTRLPGEHYVYLQAYLLLFIACAIAVNFFGVLVPSDQMVRKKSLAVLIATFPMAVITALIIISMMFGHRLNATIILSLMTSITLMILIYTEKRYRLFKLLSYMPYTQEFRLKRKIDLLIDDLIESLFEKDHNPDLKILVSRFESSVIRLAIEASNGNKTHAAQLLQIGKATLHRKISAA